MNNDVILRVNGRKFAAWTRVSVSAGIDRLARSFNLEITRDWPDVTGTTMLRYPITAGDVIEILIGDDKVITGYADGTPLKYDARSVSTSVTGRSKTGDMIDCSTPLQPGQFTNRSLVQIVTELVKPFGASVKSLTSKGAVLVNFQVDYGESINESLNRLLGLEQVLAYDDAAGNLVLDDVGNERATTALVLGQNVISADSRRDMTDLHSSYTVSGQRAGTDDDYSKATNRITYTATDPEVARFRPLIIKQCGQATLETCKLRAEFEMLQRQGRSKETTYTVQGWRQADGALWQPNQMIIVSDGVMGFDNAELVIAEVTFNFDDSEGYMTTLRVGPINAYLPEPPDPDRRRRRRRKKDDEEDDF
ncbi:phage baseplate assembly protein [Rahnella aceris]|uniref:phage baseplate assembly protein n=1 Tax=Rahnella sp. (strain Y9602) TaxID=2703885 RepID=UPI001C2740BC|nr:contractile injection system protein, VgrG/Pvc8 family [Rahnella aceris]MBU9866821.1 baseplate protein [Rahnella aceris]